MCYAAPGPRCSKHLQAKKDKIEAEFIESRDEYRDLRRRQSLEDGHSPTRPTYDQVVKAAYRFRDARTDYEHMLTEWEQTPKGQREMEALIKEAEANGDKGRVIMLKHNLAVGKRTRQEKLEKYKEAQRKKKEAELKKAEQAAAASAESFERSDTDGFVSQRSNDLNSMLHRRRAEIAEQGGVTEFPALFDLKGNLVPAKLVNTQYGQSWALLSDPDDPSSAASGWVNQSKANDPDRVRRNMEAKGYRVGTVKAPANAKLDAPAGARGLSGLSSVFVRVFRTDGGYSPDVEIVDNGT